LNSSFKILDGLFEWFHYSDELLEVSCTDKYFNNKSSHIIIKPHLEENQILES